MSTKHRNRLFFISGLAFFVLVASTAPVFASQGLMVGLGVLALSAILPLVVLLLVAYVWSGNDKAARAVTANVEVSRH